MTTDLKQIDKALSVLQAGGVIGYPTETYYGLGADIDNETAVKRLFSLKQRSFDKPILVLIDTVDQLSHLVSSVPQIYSQLIDAFWPGPLTLLFPAAGSVSSLLTGNTDTIGVRISSNPLTRELCRSWSKPLPATSANISGYKAARTANEVLEHFGEHLDFVMNSDKIWGGRASTIVKAEGDSIQIVREGLITIDEIAQSIKKTPIISR